MSFVKLSNGNIENVSILLRPHVDFISSSLGGGVTGSQHVSPVRSPCIKQVIDLETASHNLASSENTGSGVHKLNVDNYKRALAIEAASRLSSAGIKDIEAPVDMYMNLVVSGAKDVRFDKKIDAFRFDPPFKFTKNSTVKNVTRNVLMPYHQNKYDNCGFWYTNYNTLNFFNNNQVTTGSALLYPDPDERYKLPDEFAVSFWINPRYSTPGSDYNAGTILHISSSICVSLVSGSSLDEFGAADNFKILLQLSQSVDKPPSTIDVTAPAGAYPNDLIFTSSHELKKNHWHNVFITWSNTSNNSSGSIYIDDKETFFHIPSSSVTAHTDLIPDALIIGNYYDGPVGTSTTGLAPLLTQNPTQAIPPHTIRNEGYVGTNPHTDRAIALADHEFRHPLNAEIHDVRIYNKYINKKLLKYENLVNESPKTIDDMIFYLPVYFYPASSKRDVLVTPFQKIESTTADPFNVQYSFGVGGKMINLENYVLDFVNMAQPRCLGLVPQQINTTIQDITADEFTYGAIPTAKLSAAGHPIDHNLFSGLKRLLTILPNDNGLHKPQYDLLESSIVSSSDMFRKRGKALDHSIISLETLVPTASLYPGLVFVTGSIFQDICGTAPDNPGVAPGSVLTIAQRTRDVSSNEVVILDISNLYYGSRIHPRTFHLYEENLTGSSGEIKINIKDNGRGGLFRADCLTTQAEWNNIGTLLYEEGIAVIKTPNIPFYCKDKVNMKFRGEQQLHSLVLNVPAFQGSHFMSSSNRSYEAYPPDSNPNNSDLNTVHITTVNIHDDNFNVIMKAQFAQPITKTEEDEFIVRLKQDF